ncbi:MAG: hypothetical protein WC821_04980 [archaeon]|jgi:hypothetical protein
MDERLPGAILAILLFIWVIATAYFFSLTGISTQMFMTINSFPLFEKILSGNFLAFIFSASICMGLILTLGRKYLFVPALLFIGSGLILGILINFLIFQKMMVDFALPLFLLMIGIPLGIRYLKEKEHELHYLVSIRSGTSAAGRILIFACIGLFLYLVIVGSMNQVKLEQNFVPEFLNISVGNGIKLSDQFADQFATSIALQQQATITEIQKLPELSNLSAKNDPDGLMLITKLDAIKTTFSSNDFKNNISTQLKAQKIDLGTEIVKQLPLITLMSKYCWILYAISGFVMMLMICNLIVKTISSIVYAVLLMIYPKPAKAE